MKTIKLMLLIFSVFGVSAGIGCNVAWAEETYVPNMKLMTNTDINNKNTDINNKNKNGAADSVSCGATTMGCQVNAVDLNKTEATCNGNNNYSFAGVKIQCQSGTQAAIGYSIDNGTQVDQASGSTPTGAVNITMGTPFKGGWKNGIVCRQRAITFLNWGTPVTCSITSKP